MPCIFILLQFWVWGAGIDWLRNRASLGVQESVLGIWVKTILVDIGNDPVTQLIYSSLIAT